MSKINAIEVLTTWQGENPDVGKRMLLIRFKKCDRVEEKRACSWCDTLVKMRVSMNSEYLLTNLQKTIDTEYLGLMITGGEPLYDSNFNQTLDLINNLNYPIANIETNGCNLKEFIKEVNPKKNVKYIYSPKFFNSEEIQIEKNRLQSLSNESNVYVKIVYNDSGLMDEYLTFLCDLKFNNKTYLMAQGTTKEEIINHSQKEVFDAAEFYKVNFSSRDHVIYNFI